MRMRCLTHMRLKEPRGHAQFNKSLRCSHTKIWDDNEDLARYVYSKTCLYNGNTVKPV